MRSSTFIAVVLLSILPTFAQNQTTLSVPFRRSFKLSPTSPPLLLELPVSGNVYNLTIAVCGAVLPFPQFFVSNATGITLPGPTGASGSQGGEELALNDGLIQYYTQIPNGGILAVWPSTGAKANWTLDVATSERGPVHQRMSQLPLLGDTSSSRAIIFSPPFLPPSFTEPKYPNYTLQPAIPNIPTAPSMPPAPNTTLLLFPTADANETVWLTNSACALMSKLGGALVNTVSRTVLRDADGWRTQWFVDGLSPSTNYTAYVIEDGIKVSGPSYLLTKSSSFACPFVHSLPYCPMVTYPVPLPVPPNGATSYTDENMPESVRDAIISSLSNFTSSLGTFACGRDWYSPLQTCTGCQDAYRKWACSIVFPRCGEPIPDSALGISQLAFNDPNSNQRPTDIFPQASLSPKEANAAPRSPFLPSINAAYQELLPCVEICHVVDRSCPSMLQWKCPAIAVNANMSYGLGFIDSRDGTIEKGGRPGVSRDDFGRIWCNA